MTKHKALSRLIVSATACVSLAACGSEPVVDESPDDGRSASGEVLEGSISDDMIPLDQLRSQPPLMKAEPADDSNDDSGDGDAQVGEPAADAPPASPEPAARVLTLPPIEEPSAE